MWKDVLKRIDRTFGLGIQIHENDLTCTFPNGAMIYLLGADSTEQERAKILGQKYMLVVVDEAAQYSIDLDEFVYGILKPAVADYRGTIAMIGTPSNIRSGLFYELTHGQDPGIAGTWRAKGGKLKSEWYGYRWSALDNPYMKEQWQAEIDEMRASNPRVDETPIFQRHYLGRWVVEDSKLVYRYGVANAVAGLPRLDDKRGRWHFVLGIDLGYNDPSAFSLCAYHDFDPTLYVLDVECESKMDITAVAQRIRHFTAYVKNKFHEDIDSYIIDGANKQAVEEMRRRHDLQLTASNKAGKSDFIELMNGEFISGKIRVVEDGCKPLIEEYSGLIWDERSSVESAGGRRVKREEHPGCPNHCADATLYAWRHCYAYLSSKPAEPPKPGTSEWFDAEAREMEEAALARLEEQKAMERELDELY
jgi:hypothetical protein